MPKTRHLRALFHELKRRKVVRVVIAYTIAAAGTVQLADPVVEHLGLPPQTVSAVILLAVAGLPLAAVLAWLYDVVPDTHSGAANTGEQPPAPDTPPGPPSWPRAPLPAPATTFIGREDELRSLRELLTSVNTRLVTVLGPGGVGKTRLVVQCAAELTASFRDGVAFRPLSGLTAPEYVVPALAESLGVQPSRREDLLTEVESFLRERELLLVLDNFDQLIPAARQLAQLLDHAPGVRMLVTSRERLNLQHEKLLVLDGLRVDGEEVSEAVQLFVAGARRLDQRFHLDASNRVQVARICELLDGLPLAIELASAWVGTLSCDEILVQLEKDLGILTSGPRDVEERHHSLRATFDASWRLLTPDERVALARLAIFRGAFDSTAAAQVAHAESALLRQLVDKSLLTRAGNRLHMLDVVRAFAREELAQDPASERRAHERHLVWCASLLHSLEARAQRADASAIERISDSIDEVRTAWNYATESRNAAALLRMMAALFHFYESRGWAREGADAFARSSTAFGDFGGQHDVPRVVQLVAAQLDMRHGVFLHRLGDLRGAESLLRRGLAVARQLEEESEIVFGTNRLGAVRYSMGDYAEAERLHQEALTLAQRRDERGPVGWALTNLAVVAWARGEFETATRLYTEALERLREEHDLNGMWVTLNNLGVLATSRLQYEEAQRRFREALALQTELRNPRFDAHVRHNLGCAARELGDLTGARKWLNESLEVSERMGYQATAGLSLVALAELAMREEDDAAAGTTLRRALAIAAASRNHPLALEALLTLARLRLRQGDAAGAIELGAIIARHPGSDGDIRRRVAELFTEIGIDPPPSDDSVDLAGLIDRILENAVPAAPANAAAYARSHKHARTTSE